MNYDTSFLDNESAFAHGVKSVWQFARMRVKAGLRLPAVRSEIAAVLLGLLALFGLPALTWWQAWRQPGSPQNYAEWIPLLLVGWLWLNRWRIVLPELDDLNERFTERSVIRFLLEMEPEPLRRLRSPLVFAAVLTPLALRLADPTFTCAAFVLLLMGIVLYRIGTAQLRVLFFPFCLLFLMIPLPGFVLDGIAKRFDTLIFKIILHLMQIFGLNAEMGPEGNPLLIGVKGKPYFGVFSGQLGIGAAEVGVFFALALCLLSLYNAPFRAKIAAVIISGLWVGLLVIGRVYLLANIAPIADEDVFAALVPLTRWAVPLLGLGGLFLILRGLKCREFHEWVSVWSR